ncbi:unnamed protein product [Rotaria magnacalcarata]|uniref:ADP ribosyltransferase domain-containing protein n=1 Tax=Rotaria magnacalcarata TaxID=392030 RepID=A0A816GZ61_9BILA|nr:unnamed protein product [Rotaria magnacalcarata]
MAVNISDDKKNTKTFDFSKGSITATTASCITFRERRHIAQNFLLLWIDTDIDQSNIYFQTILAQLHSVVNDVNIFTQSDDCVDFLTEISDIRAFLIIGDNLGQEIVPLIHDIPHLDSVYILCADKLRHEQLAKAFVKIKGVHGEIAPICECLQQDVKQCNQDCIAMSVVAAHEERSNGNLNELEPSFMYTQIFKEILLEMEYDEQSINKLAADLRHLYSNNSARLNIIDKFERDYCPQQAIRWYTRERFTYELLNQALRKLEADTIINMGFFLRDIHLQLQELHQQQTNSFQREKLIVYRGQGLEKMDFENLCRKKGGLLSFNNFLSTSKHRDTAIVFAESVSTKMGTVGILFEMSVDRAVSSAPFASIEQVSYFPTEDEVLFSMHTVFRIGEITKFDKNSSLYRVDLQLTSDDDEELRSLTNRIRVETPGDTGWKRLGQLLLTLQRSDKAAALYTTLLEQTSDESEKAHYYTQLGYIKTDEGDYMKAIEYYEKAHGIDQKTLPPNDPSLAVFYNNIGSVYVKLGEHSKALSFYQKALQIKQETLAPHHPSLAISYNNTGSAYKNLGEYLKALSCYQIALEIKEKTLPPNHPSLATSYNNIGEVYRNIGDYSKALVFYEEALEIYKKVLLPDHYLLATSYNNVGTIYMNIGEYSKAISFYEKSLEILEKAYPPNYPALATSYNSIAYEQQQKPTASSSSIDQQGEQIHSHYTSEQQPSPSAISINQRHEQSQSYPIGEQQELSSSYSSNNQKQKQTHSSSSESSLCKEQSNNTEIAVVSLLFYFYF